MYELPENIKLPFLSLKESQQKLKNSFSGFSFTLDGKLIGDIGEVIVKQYCPELIKLREGSQHHDFKAQDGLNIQVKATQKDSVGMGTTHTIYEHLIVLRLYDEGKFEIIFDGPGSLVSHLYTESKRYINLKTLRDYNNHISRKIFPISLIE